MRRTNERLEKVGLSSCVYVCVMDEIEEDGIDCAIESSTPDHSDCERLTFEGNCRGITAVSPYDVCGYYTREKGQ